MRVAHPLHGYRKGIATLFVYYVAPIILQICLLNHLGGFVDCVVIGDLWGCAALATVQWRFGVALYLILSTIEVGVLSTNVLKPATLLWFTNLAPAIVLVSRVSPITSQRMSNHSGDFLRSDHASGPLRVYRRRRCPTADVAFAPNSPILDLEFDVERWYPSGWRLFPGRLFRLTIPHAIKYRHLFLWALQAIAPRRVSPRTYRCYFVIDRASGRVLHYSIVRTPDFQFPFMDKTDVHVGPVWTHPKLRSRGLAAMVLDLIVRELPDWVRDVWWICPMDNSASNRVALRVGFELCGEGKKRNRLGLRVLGSFEYYPYRQNH